MRAWKASGGAVLWRDAMLYLERWQREQGLARKPVPAAIPDRVEHEKTARYQQDPRPLEIFAQTIEALVAQPVSFDRKDPEQVWGWCAAVFEEGIDRTIEQDAQEQQESGLLYASARRLYVSDLLRGSTHNAVVCSVNALLWVPHLLAHSQKTSLAPDAPLTVAMVDEAMLADDALRFVEATSLCHLHVFERFSHRLKLRDAIHFLELPAGVTVLNESGETRLGIEPAMLEGVTQALEEELKAGKTLSPRHGCRAYNVSTSDSGKLIPFVQGIARTACRETLWPAAVAHINSERGL